MDAFEKWHIQRWTHPLKELDSRWMLLATTGKSGRASIMAFNEDVDVLPGAEEVSGKNCDSTTLARKRNVDAFITACEILKSIHSGEK